MYFATLIQPAYTKLITVVLSRMLHLNKHQLEHFAQGRYDILFGVPYARARTFSFPIKFKASPFSEVNLSQTKVTGLIQTNNHPRELVKFLITCHQFWLHPDKIKDGYDMEITTNFDLPQNLTELSLSYDQGQYLFNEQPVPYCYTFKPPYTQETTDGLFDKIALIHAVKGFPSKGFGEKLKKFDNGRFVPRLPAGELLCIDHIEELEPNVCRSIYNPPEQASFALILEAALQPCGWLSHHMGCLDSFEDDTYFRNLNGEITLYKTYKTNTPITFEVKLLRTSKFGGKMLVNFEVEGYQENGHLLTMQTTFGYFSQQSLAKQGGFPAELRKHPYLPRAIPRALKNSNKFMVQEVLYADENMIHCRRMLSPDDWYFKAHFFQDPVQPGSLGIQAFYDSIGLWAKKSVQPIGTCVWKYRGQTLPTHSIIDVVVSIVEKSPEHIKFSGKIFVDGVCIYDLEQAEVQI